MKFRFLMTLLAAATTMPAQTFNAGSNGSDGDLTFPNANPNDVIVFERGSLDADNDNVFHFKTITIPAGVRVKLRADKLGGPVYWLAQGDVKILGHLDLDGDNGGPAGSVAQTFAVPGPGGFRGGGGGDRSTRPPTAGFGPKGGAAGNPGINDCTAWGAGGGFTGNDFLVPLIGGSGGGGFHLPAPPIGAGGGAGGGAILLASSGTIAVAGAITAMGGEVTTQGEAGRGAGGAIRLAATRIEGSGTLHASGRSGSGCSTASENGRVRMEAFQHAFTGTIAGNSSSAAPYETYIPTSASPSVRVVSVAGISVNQNPTGAFETPDVTINSANDVPVVVEANNLPAGTVIKLQIFPENGPSRSLDLTLTGSGPTIRTTVSAGFPSGFSRGFIRASFTR